MDVGIVREPGGPSRETIVPLLDAALAARKRPVADVIGRLSRGLQNALGGSGFDPLAGTSFSELVGQMTDRTTAEVHTRILAPFFPVPGVGPAAVRGITDDFRVLAVRGDVEALEDNEVFLEGVMERMEGIIASQTSPATPIGDIVGAGGTRQAVPAGRGINVINVARSRKAVRELQAALRTNLILARRVAGEN